MSHTRRYYRVRTLVRTLVVAIPLIGGFAWALSPANTLCATEDSTNCVWDSRVQGNGQGNSFIDVNGTAYYFGIEG